MKKILFGALSFGVFLLLSITAFSQEPGEKTFKPEVQIFKLVTREGNVFIKNNSLYLIDLQNKAYQLLPTISPVDYNSLFIQVQSAQAKNKGIKAKILGKMGNSHSVIDYYFNYTGTGKEVASKKAIETNYQDFEIVRVKDVSEIEFKESEAILPTINLPAPETPQPLPPLLNRAIGTVVKTNFNSAVTFIEVKDADSAKVRAILTPSNIPTIKVVEGQMYGFETKNVVKEKMKVEIWYETRGDLNIARTISILPDSDK
jgi:hypothetical protein